MDILEILEGKKKLSKLSRKVDKYDYEIDKLQDQITDLEDEMEYQEEQKKPYLDQKVSLEWELGIRVHKNQLKLFDTND